MQRDAFRLSFLPLLLLTACPDGDVTVTTNVTTYSTMSSPSTNVTSDEPTEPTTTGLDGSDTGVPAFPSTGGPDWTSTGEDPGTDGGETTEDTTGGPGEPLPEPPSGCAHFVEVNGRQTPERRWVIIEASACDRSSSLEVVFGGDPGVEVVTGIPFNPCAVLGGTESPAANPVLGMPRVVVTIGDAVEPAAWTASLLVDGEESDSVRVPAVLQGQDWPQAPEAPFTPIHRRDDWSWVLVDAFSGSCGLAPVG